MTSYPRLEDRQRHSRTRLGGQDRTTSMALSDTGADPHQGFQRCLGLRQEVRPATHHGLLTFEYQSTTGDTATTADGKPVEGEQAGEVYGYDKVIMLAGGVGYGKKRDCLKKEPQTGNDIVVVGGDNYRIGLGGGSVSSLSIPDAIAMASSSRRRSAPTLRCRSVPTTSCGNKNRGFSDDKTFPSESILYAPS